MEKDYAEQLRRRLALYRRYLHEGVEAGLARIYLSEIAIAENLLRQLEKPRDERE